MSTALDDLKAAVSNALNEISDLVSRVVAAATGQDDSADLEALAKQLNDAVDAAKAAVDPAPAPDPETPPAE